MCFKWADLGFISKYMEFWGVVCYYYARLYNEKYMKTPGSLVDHLNELQLSSVARQGITSTRKIIGSTSINYCLGVKQVQDQVCVNFVRSHDKDGYYASEKVDQIINTLLYADYTGIFPIAMERGVNFLSTNDVDKIADELQARLMSNVVCILEGPTLHLGQPGKVLVTHLKKPHDKYYTPTDGVFDQKSTRIDGSGEVSVEDMIEYKTTARFTPNKILKILVPEQLMPIARRVFTTENAKDKLQAVPTTSFRMHSIPMMLKEFMTDQQPFPLGDYEVPDYYSVIAKELEKDNIVMHAIRLHTQWDLRPVPVTRPLSNQEKAYYQLFQNQDGLIHFVHATSMIDIEPLISKSRSSNLRPLSHKDFLLPNRRQGVLDLKGDYVTFRVPMTSSIQQDFNLISKFGISTLRFVGYGYVFIKNNTYRCVKNTYGAVTIKNIRQLLDKSHEIIRRMINRHLCQNKGKQIIALMREKERLSSENFQLQQKMASLVKQKASTDKQLEETEQKLSAIQNWFG